MYLNLLGLLPKMSGLQLKIMLGGTMQKNRMLRLFGIAENDSGQLFVSEHAKQNNK